MATPFTPVTGSSSIGSTEFSLPNNSTTLTPQTTAVKLEAHIDFSAMVAGDQYRVQVLDKVAGGSQVVVFEAFLTNAQVAAYVIPTRCLNEGWDVRVKLIAGSARTIGWDLKEDVGDRNVLTIAANAITAAAAAADFGAELAAAVWAAVSEGAETFGDAIRLIGARLYGKATVQDGDGVYVFRDKGDTKNRLSMTRTGTARTVGTRDGT